MPPKQRQRCGCGSYMVVGCKKCGRRQSASNGETLDRLRGWAQRQKALGLVSAFEWAVLDRMADDLFGERL